MRVVPAPLQTELNNRVTHLCRLLEVTLPNGNLYRYTDHDLKILYLGEYYLPYQFTLSAVRSNMVGDATNASIEVLLSETSALFSENAIRRGQLDDAQFVVRVVNWENPSAGSMILHSGEFGEIDFTERGRAKIDIVGLSVYGEKVIGEVFSKTCRAEFGDERCKFPIATITEAFTMTTVSADGMSFQSNNLIKAGNNHFNFGWIEFTSGDNDGTVIELTYSNADGTIMLAFATPYPIAIGDTGTATPGCSKELSMCHDRWNNVLNFRGEPHVPIPQEQAEVVPAPSETKYQGGYGNAHPQSNAWLPTVL